MRGFPDGSIPTILAGLSFPGFLESLIDGFAAVDLDGRIRASNPAFRSMLGYTEEEISGLGYEDITPSLWHEMEGRILAEEVFVRGYSGVYEKEYRSKAGKVFPVELRTSLLAGPEGRPAGMWCIVRDITERKRVEARLLDSEERFRGAFEDAAVGMALADPSGRLLRVNKAMARMLGYSEDELIRRGFLDLTYEEDRQLDWDLHLELVAGTRNSFQIEKRYVRKDGSLIWGRLTTSALAGPDGRIVLGMVEDITARKRQEGLIAHSLEEKAILLKEVHHRVKNNLQLIASLLSLQMASLAPDSEAEKVRNILEGTSGRVRSMAGVHEIIYASEDFTGLDFAHYLRSLAQDLVYGQEAEAMDLELDLEDLWMSLDKAIPCGLLVNEALTNIARHAYPQGWQGKRTVRICLAARPGGRILLEIGDRGIGMGRPGPGKGLGLAIMEALASQIGGQLGFSPGEGTTVVLDLPQEGAV